MMETAGAAPTRLGAAPHIPTTPQKNSPFPQHLCLCHQKTYKKEKIMQDKNVDFCGILNLLTALKRAGFPKTELEQVAARIAVQTGATIPISF